MKPDIFFDPETHEYLVDGVSVPSVTTILSPLSARGYANVNPSVLEYARNRGTAVHEALELMDYGAEPEITPEILPYINAYMEWQSIYKPKWDYIEHIIYKYDDVCERGTLAGTLDRAGTLNGTEYAIVDIKTSSPTKEALVSVCLQTKAYEVMYHETFTGYDELVMEYAPHIKRYGLFLKKDGTFRFLDCEEYEKKYKIKPLYVLDHLIYIHNFMDEIFATGKKGEKE